jgi:hypothetical protein
MIILSRIILLSLALSLFAAGGCTTAQGPAGTSATYRQWGVPPTESDTEAKRFQDAPLAGRTAVESAIEISEKYARLSEQMLALREENQRLTTENDSLRQQTTSLETKLAQTQKELKEANDLLLDMLQELNMWKSNILGFRDEMRNAAQAQLEALLKVLEILGGEVEAGTLKQQYATTLDSNLPASAEPNQPAAPPAEDANDAR